jgi:hemerythrin-like domain-containing protein
MSEIPKLLNDDGTASIATMLMMTHHAFRRDLARFLRALENVAAGDVSRVEALRTEWQSYRAALHGHHTMEDTQVFPNLTREHAELAPIVQRLTEEHHHIDPLLERGDHAFDALPSVPAAKEVLLALKGLLDPHLATEEAQVVPFLRGAQHFPAPSSDADVELYASGFAWTSHGIAPDVLERVYAMLPVNLASKLPAARAAFEARCERAWGTTAAGASRTPIPDGP